MVGQQEYHQLTALEISVNNYCIMPQSKVTPQQKAT